MIVEVYTSESENSRIVIPITNHKENLPHDAILERTIEGTDWDDCMKKHHEIMGWEPYKPF